MTSIKDHSPDLIPARMVNEYAFCPRFFYLAWVDGHVADNPLTVEGKAMHRRSDQETGAAPLPGEGEVRVARAVLLASDRLGLIARIDLLEADGESVVPVDIKGGHGPPAGKEPWEPELVQLAVQGLLLREAGYQCDRGVLSFVGSRRRFDIQFDDELCSRTLELVDEMRVVATQDRAPPPLIDSSKCRTCIHNVVCLPDEINALTGRVDTRPKRRLLPSFDEAAPLYVTEQGAYLKKDKGRIEVRKDGERLSSVRMLDISHVSLFGNVNISTPLMRHLLAEDVGVSFFTYGGWFSGVAHGMPTRNVSLRMPQYRYADARDLSAARQIVRGKIRNSRTMLMRNSRERDRVTEASLMSLSSRALKTGDAAELLGIEGSAARLYFARFESMLNDRSLASAFDFSKRNRRPPTDRVNCVLSFAYGLVVRELTSAAITVGLDPMVGVFHTPRFGRPAMALDIAEEFRPIVAESIVLQVINNGELGPSEFHERAGGVGLTTTGRRAVIRAFERRMRHEIRHPLFGYQVSYRRAMEVQVRLMAAFLLGETDEYVPLMTR